MYMYIFIEIPSVTLSVIDQFKLSIYIETLNKPLAPPIEFQCMCKCTHAYRDVYILICIYIYTCIYIYICIHIYVHMYKYMYIHMCICIYMYTYIHNYVYIYTNIYIIMYIYTHTYIYIYTTPPPIYNTNRLSHLYLVPLINIYMYIYIHIYVYIYIYIYILHTFYILNIKHTPEPPLVSTTKRPALRRQDTPLFSKNAYIHICLQDTLLCV